MKKHIFLLSLVLSGTSFGQNFAINATGAAGNASAALDVDMAGKGILIPRLALTATNVAAPVTAPATSLMVYNTATAGAGLTAVSPGYYYWDGVKWVRLLGGTSNTFWIVGSSAATVNTPGATGFIGTSDNNHVDFVTNGIVRGRLSNLGEFFIGTTATSLPGDLMNGVGNATFPWAINGYTNQDAGGVYGLRLAGSIGTWGAVQGETDATNPANSAGVRGGAAATSQIGVIGTKPLGGLGFGGLFLNDLGYTGGFFNVSDERLKIGVNPLNNALQLVNQIELYSYYMDTLNYTMLGDGSRHFGVMAQQLKQVVPDLVKEKNFNPGQLRTGTNLVGPDFSLNVVNYMELIPLALQAIKEQQVIIVTQQQELDALKKRLELIEQQLLLNTK